MEGKLVEEIYVACVTPARKIITVQKLAEGSATEISLTIRKVTDLIGASKCHNVIIAHNHPGGTCNPSEEDDKFTKALAVALAMTETQLLDHIIIGENDYYSYYSSNKLISFLKPYSHLFENGKLSKKFDSYR